MTGNMIKAVSGLFLIIITAGLALFAPVQVYAAEEGIYSIMENQLDFNEMDAVIDKSMDSSYKVKFSDLAYKAVSGSLDLSMNSILDIAGKLFFHELYYNAATMRSLILLGILGAILNTLTLSFKNKAVGELGFYACYMVVVITLLSSFQAAVGILSSLIDLLSQIMEASLPLMMSLLVMSGNVSGAYVINPALMFAINIIAVFIRNVLTPVITMAAVIEIINYLTNRSVLSKLVKLVKSTIKWSLKSISGLFVSILALQRITAPIVNNLAVKTGKAAARAVPVVGNVLDGALDTALYWASSVKSGVLAAVIIVIIIACAIPLIKLLAIAFMYKLTSAFIQPVANDRIADCIDSIGEFSMFMLWSGITVVTMFLFAVMIVLSF